MPDALTRNDAIAIYLSGASSDGGSQSDPDASLGNYRSSSLVQQLTWEVTNPIANIDIEYIERRSLLLDLSILLNTPRVVLSGSGAR